MSQTRIGDVMTRGVPAVGVQTSYKQVAAVLAEHDLRAVPVVDSAGRVLGVVSEADLLIRAAGGVGRHHPQLNLRQALTPRSQAARAHG